MIYVFALYCLGLLLLSIGKSLELCLPQIHQLQSWLGGDKLMHFKLSLLLGLLSCFVVNWLKARFSKNGLLLFVIMQLLLVIGLFVDEAHQFIATSRRFEWMDLYYGLSGLVAGSVLYAVLLLLKYYLGLLFKRA